MRRTPPIIKIISQALATAATPPPTTPQDSLQCCDTVLRSTSSAASAVAGFYGVDLKGLDVSVVLSCDPTTVDGIKWCVSSMASNVTFRLMDDSSSNGRIVNCAAPDKKWGS
jgi:hypothetical protein